MEKNFINLALLTVIFSVLTACTVVGTIFKAGMLWGIFLVLGFFGFIIYIVAKAGRRKD